MSQQKWGVTFIVMVAAFVAVIAIAANADSEVFRVESGTRTSSDQLVWEQQLSQHGLGLSCTVEASETNEPQPSAHPGNTLIVSIDGVTVLTMPMETGRGGSSATSVHNVPIGEPGIIRAEIDLGDDGVSSAGFAVAVLNCEGETPSTTTSSSSSTTTVPTSTTVPVSTTSSSTSTTGTETTSTSSPPSPSPSVTVPTSTVPETTPIRPTGVPTGEPIPETHSLWPAFWILATGLVVMAAGTGYYIVKR